MPRKAAVTFQGVQTAPPKPIQPFGVSRWEQLKPFIPVCRETWRTMALEGRAPAPIRLSPRCTVYNNAEVLRWLEDPVGYRAAA